MSNATKVQNTGLLQDRIPRYTEVDRKIEGLNETGRELTELTLV